MLSLSNIGHGYVAQNTSDYIKSKINNAKITAINRPSDKINKLLNEGKIDDFVPIEDKYISSQTNHLLISIPPTMSIDIALYHYQQTITKLCNLQWVGLLSSTSVYGNTDGDWVTEESPTQPDSSIYAQQRIRSENMWMEYAKQKNIPLHIFRLAGIYGPGRSTIDKLREQSQPQPIFKIHKPNHVLCRIHVEDIANILWHSMQHPNPYSIYNLSDDLPAPYADIIDYASTLLGIIPPETINWDDNKVSPRMKTFFNACRRVNNNKIKDEFNIKLQYPFLSGRIAPNFGFNIQMK